MKTIIFATYVTTLHESHHNSTPECKIAHFTSKQRAMDRFDFHTKSIELNNYECTENIANDLDVITPDNIHDFKFKRTYKVDADTNILVMLKAFVLY